MNLRFLKLINFRNLKGSYKLYPHLNIIVGQNGLGKTNFLEAINYLSAGKSFRTSNDLLAIKFQRSKSDVSVFARLEGEISDGIGNIKKYEIIIEKENHDKFNECVCRKTLRINGKRTIRKNLFKNFLSIVFSPDTIDLVHGSPYIRRKELNDFLGIYDDGYLEILNNYKKVLHQKNKLLEVFTERHFTLNELNVWNRKLAEFGSSLIFRRLKFIKEIKEEIHEFINNFYKDQKFDIKIKYISKFTKSSYEEGIKKLLEEKLEENTAKEIRAGISLYGPHKEDFIFLLNNLNLREFGSRGQQRICSFIFKISQAVLYKKRFNQTPILLLDDLFSELDDNTRKRLQEILKIWDGQIILTGLSKREFRDKFFSKANVIAI